MASSNNVFVQAGFVEDGFYQLATVAPDVPVVINLGTPGDAVRALPFRGLGGSVLDLDLLYGLIGADGPTTDLQPIFVLATRDGLYRAFAERIPRAALAALCVRTYATLKSLDDIVIEGSPLGPNLFGSVGLTTMPTFSVRLDNSDGTWNHLVLDELIQYAPAGIFVDIAQTVCAPAITGEISAIVFDGSDVIVSGGFSTRVTAPRSLTARLNLDQRLLLRTAGEYAFPGSATDLLPEVFGNWLSADVGASTSTAVATPCILINRLDLVYCANARRTAAASPVVMGNGVIQDPSTYEWNPAENYEGRGIIATLRFKLAYVTQMVISIRHGGAVDGSGQPITNPMAMIQTMGLERAHWTSATFDAGTCEQTRRDLDFMGYPAYWVWREDRTIRDWLLELCAHYHCDFVETANAQLAIVFDRTMTALPVTSEFHVAAQAIEDHGSLATAIRLEMHGDDVVNQVTLHGRHNWSTGEMTVDYPWDYPQSQSAYGDPDPVAYPAEFSFRGMYTMAHATAWLHSFAVRHGFDPTTVSFTLRGLYGFPLIPPRLITVEAPWLGWQERLLKITKTIISFSRRAIDLICIDCQRELDEVPDLPSNVPAQQSRPLSTVYTWLPGSTGESGLIDHAPVSQRNECANGSLELGNNGQWDLVVGNPGPQWTIVDDQAGALIGRHYAVSVPNAGNGSAISLLQRIDPGEYALVTAWFRQHVVGTNGTAVAIIHFYAQNGTYLGGQQGNFVVPTSGYLESVAFAQAPAGSFHYRPGIGFATASTTGQWRFDKVNALSGSKAQVLAARQSEVGSSNLITNGEFEYGPIMFILTPGSGWDISNNPAFPAHGGIWYAAHNAVPAGIHRLSSLSQIGVIPGQTFTMSVWVLSTGTPNGTARMGVTWIGPQGAFLFEDALAPGPISFPTYTFSTGSVLVPVGASFGHVWIEASNHTAAGSLLIVDDWSVRLS